jgi:hypothetical protein
MRLKSEKARQSKLAHLDKKIREYEEKFPQFPVWFEILKKHTRKELRELSTWKAWSQWPESFYREVGYADPIFRTRKWGIPHEYAFFCYLEYLAEREQVKKAPLLKGGKRAP